ncbi:MAG: myo-inositol-1(or 4)-monophosphatase [Microgenomates group bacterium Gr01-1014_7]|nr:MAG: myo-inositol-1(or 4)-monophosphatase [Microgenomates group bacterium Gr01-1014_7]
MIDSEFLKVAKQAAIEAGKIVKKYYQSELTLYNKGHFTNFATEADLQTEKKIIEIIKRNFPTHNIIAEESGGVKSKSEYTWVIDPIDGTIAFVDGIPTFGISIGLLKNNEPFLGVISLVATSQLYWAEAGTGAFLNGKRISTRKISNLENCTIAFGYGHKDGLAILDSFFRPLMGRVRQIYLFGSAVSSMCYIARGMIDSYIISGHVWDVAAGAIIVKEAGGKVTDLGGNKPDWTKDRMGLVLSNGLIHDQILEVLK